MHRDVTNLRDFYSGPLGTVVRRILAERLRARWRNVSGMTMIGLGFATPFLGKFREEAGSVTAFMPASQGALVWPATGLVRSVLVDERNLPLPDTSVDRIILAHCLEACEGPRPLLREIWRVLKPEGRMVMIVPNRRSIWARIDSTPFGHGQPFSRSQIETLLAQAMFTPIGWSSALSMPPWERPFLLRGALAWERIGATLAPAFAGALIVESQKELMAPISGGLRIPARAKLAGARGDAFSNSSKFHINRPALQSI